MAMCRSLGHVALAVYVVGTFQVGALTLETEQTLREKIRDHPQEPTHYLNLMQWHLKWGELSKAIEALKAAIDKDPTHAWQYQERIGDLQWKYAKDQHAAEARYREALKGNPTAKRALLHFGMLQVWRGRREEADRLFDGAVEAGVLRDIRQRPLEVLDRSLPGRGPWDDGLLSRIADPWAAALKELSDSVPVFWAEYLKWNRTRPQDAEADAEGLLDPHSTGRWQHFWVYHPRFERGVWNGNCHYKTSKTCDLLKRLNKTVGGLRVLRAGFDVLEPGTTVRPHCHPSNRELLVDTALRVPRLGAAAVKSGAEERAWAPGDVRVLDPSYEHEEVNNAKAASAAGQPDINYADELHRFYGEQGMLEEKKDELPSILEKWKGREEKMMRELRKKYLADRGERILLRLLVAHPEAKQQRSRADPTSVKQSSGGGSRGGVVVQPGSSDEL